MDISTGASSRFSNVFALGKSQFSKFDTVGFGLSTEQFAVSVSTPPPGLYIVIGTNVDAANVPVSYIPPLTDVSSELFTHMFGVTGPLATNVNFPPLYVYKCPYWRYRFVEPRVNSLE